LARFALIFRVTLTTTTPEVYEARIRITVRGKFDYDGMQI